MYDATVNWSSGSLSKDNRTYSLEMGKKLNCFNLEHWLKDYLELLSMEQAASALQVMNNRFSDTWTSIRSPPNIFHVS